MIKLSQAEKDFIMQQAFLDELEKQAFWSALGKAALPILKKIVSKAPKKLVSFGKSVKNKGFSNAFKATNTHKWAQGGVAAVKKGQGLKYFSSFAGPGSQLSKATLKSGKINIKKMQRVGAEGGTLARGIRTSIGNTAQNLMAMGKGVQGKGFISGTKQFGKNLVDVSKKQLRASQYKEVALKKGQTTVKGGGFLKNFKSFDRKVVATTNRGTGLVKKRAIVRPAAAAFTAPGMAATGMLTGPPKETGTNVGQQKKPGLAKRVGYGVKEGLPWLVGAPVGMASMFLTGSKKKRNNGEEANY